MRRVFKRASTASGGKSALQTAPTLALQRKCSCTGSAGTSGECERCRMERVQRHATKPTQSAEIPQIVHDVLGSPGEPLGTATRMYFEPQFGHDLSKVRVHTDSKAARSAKSVNSLAYTVGDDIVFDASKYSPNSTDGRKLLAHELTHVLQQSDAQGSARLGDLGAPQEREAERAERAVERGERVHISRSQTQTLRRQPASEHASEKADDERTRVLRAAERARLAPNDRTQLSLAGAEIVYRMVRLYMPEYSNRLSSAGYDDTLTAVRVEVTSGAIAVTVGRQFVLGTNERSLDQRALALGGAILAKAPRTDSPPRGLLGSMITQQQRAPGPPVSFEDALKEAATVLHATGFGKVCGQVTGADPGDGYDAREWREQEGRHEVLVAKTEPWLAFSNLVRNLGQDVPAASGGTTRWKFDCFGHVILGRVYAHWRTLTRGEFNSRFTPLELGIASRVNAEWEKPIVTLKPGDKPFVSGGVKGGAGGVFVEERIPVGRSWDELLEGAPIGTQVTFGNQDAITKCGVNPGLSFCAFSYENTWKVGPNQYSAHPFGVRSRQFIEDEMAKAVLVAEHRPATEEARRSYIKRFIFISGMRVPKRQTITI